MHPTHLVRFLSLVLIAPAACAYDGALSGDSASDLDDADGKADQISGADDPSRLLGNAERRLSALITKADIGESFGVPDAEVPYPDTYWPMIDNGVAVEWLEKDGSKCFTPNECDEPQPSPLVKLVSIINPSGVDRAVDWEIKNHGKDVPNVASWFGHCPGWVATAMLNKPIPGPVWVKGNALDLTKCEANDPECTKFEIGDINALGAEAHEGAFSKFIGARCDTEPSDIERDEFGRIVRDGKGCKGLNAGAMAIVIGNRLKKDGKPFAIDAQNEFNTEQIWNQPAFRYTVNRFEDITESEAANLVASGGDSRDGEHAEYLWNSKARGFAFVDFTLHWVTEHGPNLTPFAGANSSRTTRMVAVLELDAEPSDPDAEIVGGEYLDDRSVGADRLNVAPFVWIALDAGPDFRHNPEVKAALVKQLIALAAEGDDDGGDPTCNEHATCDTGAPLDAGCGDSCVADICDVDPYCCNNSWDEICVGEVASVCGQTCD
jgi:hypothetical protein